MKQLCIVILTLLCSGLIHGQTIQISKAQWTAVMKGKSPTPFRPPNPPYRQITKINSFDDGDTKHGYAADIISENFSRENSRFYRVERIGTKIRSEEKISIGKTIFTRLDEGEWIAADIPSRTKAVRVRNDPVNPKTVRKPNSEEFLYFSLGERPFKGRTASVYEEVTRHVLIRTADNSEIHFENRTRIWITDDQSVARYDTYYAIFDSAKTTRIITSREWEKDERIKPFEAPIK